MFLLECWFGRSDGSVSGDWNRVVEENLYKWETVRWWSPGAIMMNRICKEMRDAGEIPARPAQVEG
ncbi:hypothetical protein J3459_013066 [Metarhizium acridum]|nr:hypothetical protein J3459_013066 [Metarhizium acridum]